MTYLAAFAAALVIPGFTPVATGPQGGTVLQGVMPGTERPGLVYLPPGFTETRRYPVVYLLHGMPGSPTEFLAGAGFLAWADDSIANGAVPPFLAVMPAAGPTHQYNGEWAGPWERAIVDHVVPWADATLPTRPDDRVLAGLSAGGYGAADIALRHPGMFHVVESWSGYFQPLTDGPFKDAPRKLLDANDPRLLAPSETAKLRADGTRFFLSTGPFHSHWFRPAETVDFARELERLALPVRLLRVQTAKGEYPAQLTAGLTWALAPAKFSSLKISFAPTARDLRAAADVSNLVGSRPDRASRALNVRVRWARPSARPDSCRPESGLHADSEAHDRVDPFGSGF